MPKSTDSAAAIGLPVSGPLGRIPAGARANVVPADRRGFLKALAGAAALASSTAALEAVANQDPIFAAIETHRRREAEFDDICHLTDGVAAAEEGRQVTEADEAAYELVNGRAEEALESLAAEIPQSVRGIRALLSYFADELDLAYAPAEIVEGCMRSILASPALAGGSHV
jgi:hypothetical protein